MDASLAIAILETFAIDYNSQLLTAGMAVSLKSPFEELDAVPEEGKRVKRQKKIETEVADRKEEFKKAANPEGCQEKEASNLPRGSPGWGKPLQAYYKGLHREIHDGGGLCSPGRWAVDKRKPLVSEDATALAAEVKKLFLSWMAKAEAVKKGGVQDIFWKLAAGLCKESPFGETMVEQRHRLDRVIVGLGFDPARREGDRQTEINFRRLGSVLQILQDEDFEYLDQMASQGVILGADEEMPRVERVFEEKTKWAREFTDELMEDRMAENYPSAEESWEDIVRQVEEDHSGDGWSRGREGVRWQTGSGGSWCCT